MENEVLKAIKERRSIRRFKADQITDEELKTVLEAGTWAATGHGTQDLSSLPFRTLRFAHSFAR